MNRKVVARIEPIPRRDGSAVLMLPGLYDNGSGKYTCISPSGTVSTIDKIDKTNENYINADNHVFDSSRGFKEITIEKNLSPEHETRKMQQVEKVIEAWARHPQIVDIRNPTNDPELPYYNSNLKAPLFQIVRPDEQVKKKNNNTRDKLKAANMANTMTTDELKSVAFFFGLNPSGWTEDELFDNVAGFENGVIMREPNLQKFLAKFENLTKEVELEITIQKAIQMTEVPVAGFSSIFEKRSTGYYLNGTYIGNTAEKVVHFFSEKESKELYESYVLKAVNEREGKKNEINAKKEPELVEKGISTEGEPKKKAGRPKSTEG